MVSRRAGTPRKTLLDEPHSVERPRVTRWQTGPRRVPAPQYPVPSCAVCCQPASEIPDPSQNTCSSPFVSATLLPFPCPARAQHARMHSGRDWCQTSARSSSRSAGRCARRLGGPRRLGEPRRVDAAEARELASRRGAARTGREAKAAEPPRQHIDMPSCWDMRVTWRGGFVDHSRRTRGPRPALHPAAQRATPRKSRPAPECSGRPTK